MAGSTYDSFRFLPTPSTAYAVPLRPGGKRLTWFSGRFAPLRTKFACHLQAGGGKFKVYVVPPPRWQVLVNGAALPPHSKRRPSFQKGVFFVYHSLFFSLRLSKILRCAQDDGEKAAQDNWDAGGKRIADSGKPTAVSLSTSPPAHQLTSTLVHQLTSSLARPISSFFLYLHTFSHPFQR